MGRRATLFRQAAWIGAAVLLTINSSQAAAQNSPEYRFELPSMSLSKALREVAVRTGRDLLAPEDLVRGRQAPPLSGEYSAEQAVQKLLEGSGLAYRSVEGTLVVQNPQGQAEGETARPSPGGRPGEASTIVVTGTRIRGGQPTSPVIILTREDIERTGATSVDQLMRTVPQNTQSGVNKENAGIALPDQDVTDHGAGLNLRGLGQR